MLRVVTVWEDFKDWLSATAHLSHWTLHVVFGLAFYLLFGRLLRRPLSSLLPILPVALLELGNETLDFLRAWLPHWYWNWPDSLREVGLTLGPPLLVALAARALPVGRSAIERGWLRLRFPPRREHIFVRLYRQKRLPHRPR